MMVRDETRNAINAGLSLNAEERLWACIAIMSDSLRFDVGTTKHITVVEMDIKILSALVKRLVAEAI